MLVSCYMVSGRVRRTLGLASNFFTWLSSRNFFGGESVVIQIFLLCYCFRTKFKGGAKVFRGAPPAPHGRKPVYWSQQFSLKNVCLQIGVLQYSYHVSPTPSFSNIQILCVTCNKPVASSH